MNTALHHVVITETQVEPLPSPRREVVHISHVAGKDIPLFVAALAQRRAVGQLVVNYSTGCAGSAQWIEKIRD